MLIRMVFKEKNMLGLGPGIHFGMRAEMIAQALIQSKQLYEATWDRDLWKSEKQIRIEVRSPMLGHHIYIIDGTERELTLVAEALEKHFATQ